MKTGNIQYKMRERERGREGLRMSGTYFRYTERWRRRWNERRRESFAEIYVLQKYLMCSFLAECFSCMFSLLSTIQRFCPNNFHHHALTLSFSPHCAYECLSSFMFLVQVLFAGVDVCVCVFYQNELFMLCAHVNWIHQVVAFCLCLHSNYGLSVAR